MTDHEDRNSLMRLSRIADPVIAAEIADAALKRAKELVAEGPYRPEVLMKIAATIGPIKVKPQRRLLEKEPRHSR